MVILGFEQILQAEAKKEIDYSESIISEGSTPTVHSILIPATSKHHKEKT